MDAFWTTLRDQTLMARTPYLVVAYLLTAFLARSLPPLERPWMRHARNFLVAHITIQIGIAVLAAFAYESLAAECFSLAFELLAIVGLSNVLVFRIVVPRLGLTTPRILIDIVTAISVLIAMIAVGKRAGFSVTGIITTSAVLTAVIGFALQDTLGNIMGGLALQMDNSVRLGDWISLGPGQPQGRVSEIRWRYTAIETRAWETIIIPNGQLMKSQVVIAGRRHGEASRWRKQVDFFVDFRTVPTDVIRTVRTALITDPPPRVVIAPEPQVLFIAIRDSVAQYCVRYWTDDISADEPTDSDVRVRIYYALARAGLKMSIPATAVFLTTESDARDERKASEDAAERLAAVDTVELFRRLDDTMKAELAAELVYAPFARGEAVTHEGAREDGLYMIVRGEASVRIGHDGSAREVARLVAGQVFGEMSLMTGEARTATVVAISDLVCYRVDKSAFQILLENHPEVAEVVAEVLAARKMELDAARGELKEPSKKELAKAKQDLLGRIRGFFGLRS
jgi:small-conductance mechanosensitive channel/CRP-like cAMP-binding protein